MTEGANRGNNSPTSEQVDRAARAIYEVTGGGVPFGPVKRGKTPKVTVSCQLLAETALDAGSERRTEEADRPITENTKPCFEVVCDGCGECQPFVSNEYATAFQDGALAALDYIAGEQPDLEDVTMAGAEHIGRVLDLMLGRDNA